MHHPEAHRPVLCTRESCCCPERALGRAGPASTSPTSSRTKFHIKGKQFWLIASRADWKKKKSSKTTPFLCFCMSTMRASSIPLKGWLCWRSRTLWIVLQWENFCSDLQHMGHQSLDNSEHLLKVCVTPLAPATFCYLLTLLKTHIKQGPGKA